jgi:hypothetical protein
MPRQDQTLSSEHLAQGVAGVAAVETCGTVAVSSNCTPVMQDDARNVLCLTL